MSIRNDEMAPLIQQTTDNLDWMAANMGKVSVTNMVNYIDAIASMNATLYTLRMLIIHFVTRHTQITIIHTI